MQTKRLLAIASATPLLDQQEMCKDRDQKTHKKHLVFNGRKKTDATTVFLRNFNGTLSGLKIFSNWKPFKMMKNVF